MELRLVSVNVGMPRVIGTVRDEPVLSGIAKSPVTASSVCVRTTNIEGDGQADLSVHGGVDKAVYCYPTDHWPWWERENAFACRPGAFGENLTIEGADETMVAIGDRFRWGDVLLEVSQPRAPCFKLAIYAKRPDAPSLITRSGRSGWYFRVVREGIAPASGTLLELQKQTNGPSVREAFFAALDPKTPVDRLQRVEAAPALAESWRNAVLRHLDR
jgi:MOSC domain-containing protein YiiM